MDGRRRREAGAGVRRNRRLLLQHHRKPGAYSRFQRDGVEDARHQSRTADLPVPGTGFQAYGCAWERGEGYFGVIALRVWRPDMPSPFPGMNPYLERPRIWHGFHERLIAAMADAIQA